MVESSPTNHAAGQFWVGFIALLFAVVKLFGPDPWSRGPEEPRWTIGVELESDTASFGQLFFDRGAGYRQEDSSTAPIQVGKNRLIFTVRGRTISRFRFDPLDGAGRVTIHRMWDGNAFGKESREIGHLALKPENQIATLERNGNDLVVTTTPGANDPMLSFDTGRPLVAAPTTDPRSGTPWLILAVAGGLALLVCRKAAAPAGFDGSIALLGVAAAAFGLLYLLHTTLDVPVWDEANYLGAGRRALHGDFGPLDGAATYHGWYALLLSFWPDERAVFANHYALKLLLPLLATLVARRWFGSWISAALIGLSVALSDWNVGFPLLVYQATWVWWLAALATIERRRWLGLGFAALAALTRFEFVFPLVAMLAITAFTWWRERRARAGSPVVRSWKQHLPALVVWAAVALLMTRITDWNPGAARSWFAFQQHYAVAASARGELSGENPWLSYPKLIARDFPQAHSLGEALRQQPSKVINHVASNLTRAPGEVETFLETASTSGPRWLAAVFLFAGGMLAAAPRTDGLRGWWAENRISLTLALCGALATAPGLIIYAKTAYLLPALPLVWAGVALGGVLVSSAVARAGSRAQLVAALLAVAGGVWGVAAAKSPFDPLRALRPVARTLSTLRTECPAPCRLLGVTASSYAHYLGDGFTGIEPLASVTGRDDSGGARTLPDLVAHHRATAVLVNADWRNSGEFDAAGPAALQAAGWREVPVPGGTLLLQPFHSAAGRSQ